MTRGHVQAALVAQSAWLRIRTRLTRRSRAWKVSARSAAKADGSASQPRRREASHARSACG